MIREWQTRLDSLLKAHDDLPDIIKYDTGAQKVLSRETKALYENVFDDEVRARWISEDDSSNWRFRPSEKTGIDSITVRKNTYLEGSTIFIHNSDGSTTITAPLTIAVPLRDADSVDYNTPSVLVDSFKVPAPSRITFSTGDPSREFDPNYRYETPESFNWLALTAIIVVMISCYVSGFITGRLTK